MLMSDVNIYVLCVLSDATFMDAGSEGHIYLKSTYFKNMPRISVFQQNKTDYLSGISEGNPYSINLNRY